MFTNTHLLQKWEMSNADSFYLLEALSEIYYSNPLESLSFILKFIINPTTWSKFGEQTWSSISHQLSCLFLHPRGRAPVAWLLQEDHQLKSLASNVAMDLILDHTFWGLNSTPVIEKVICRVKTRKFRMQLLIRYACKYHWGMSLKQYTF